MIKKQLLSLLLLIVLIFSQGAQAFAISATGACSMDYTTGELLYSKNADAQMTPASLTKIMTLYVIFEKLADGTLTKNTLIPISQNAAKLSVTSGYSNIPLVAGESLSVDTLIQAIVTVSACACCTAIAEYLSGSESAFTNLMHEKASEIGVPCYFTDASGISNYNLISPAGLAKLTQTLITKYPDILSYTGKPSVTLKGKKYKSTNLLLSTASRHYYSGADGFKTGTTNLAGKCLVATASRNGRRIISVVMKAPTNDSRYTDTIELLNNAFSTHSGAPSDNSGSLIANPGSNAAPSAPDNEGALPASTYLYSTDIRTYIDGYQIPCTYFYGISNTLCVTAENLDSFGFDVVYDESSSTVYIYDKPAKEIYTMVPSDLEPMLPLYQIIGTNTTKAVLVTEEGSFPLSTAFTLNGHTAVSIDEIALHFPSYWDEAERILHLYTE